MKSMRALRGALVCAALITIGADASAQGWPTRSMQVVSPFTAGNANDIIARIVLEQVGKQLGQTFIIENRPGGGGVIGAAQVAKADPDGYTFLLHSSSLSSHVILHRSLPYDGLRDFAPIVLFGIQPSVLVTSPVKGFKTVADLVAAAKAKPGELNFASAGVGSASHIAGEKFRVAAGITVQHVPYKGPVEAFTDVMAGRIDFYFVPISPAVPVIQQGKIVPLAVSTAKRAALLPDVPTIAEAGYPNAEYLFWGGLSAPAKTPRAIVVKLHDEVQKALDMPAIQQRLAQLGVQPKPMTPEQYAKFFAEDVASMIKLGKDANIVPTQ
jgi:tripartite-type tricarboxylate transporter receptor subunit TctC